MSVTNLTLSNGIVSADAYAHGGRAWIARVKHGGKYGLDREFGSKFDRTVSGNVYREIELVLRNVNDGECVELACKESSRREVRSYYRVAGNDLQPIEVKQLN